MKNYVTPEMAIQTIAPTDVITLSITRFQGVFNTGNGDSIFEDDGMNI